MAIIRLPFVLSTGRGVGPPLKGTNAVSHRHVGGKEWAVRGNESLYRIISVRGWAMNPSSGWYSPALFMSLFAVWKEGCR